MDEQYDVVKHLTEKSKEKDEVIAKFKEFSNVTTRTEAQEMLLKNFPESKKRNKFYIWDYEISVVNKDDLLRICFDSPTEFISYDFVK